MQVNGLYSRSQRGRLERHKGHREDLVALRRFSTRTILRHPKELQYERKAVPTPSAHAF